MGGKPRSFTDAVEEQIAQEYRDGASTGDLAAKYRTTKRTVSKALDRQGVPRRPLAEAFRISPVRAELRRKIKERKTDRAEKAKELYATGHTTYQIGDMLGCSKTLIMFDLEAEGVPRRTRAETHRQYHADDSFFDSISTEEQAWFLGWIVTDGSVAKRNPTLSFTLQRRDRCVLETFLRLLKSNYPIRDADIQTKGGRLCPVSSIAIRSDGICRGLLANGIGPAKTYTCRPWEGPPHLMRHYWRGVIEGDGSFVKKRQIVKTIDLSGTRAMVEGFAAFVSQQAPDAHPYYTPGTLKNRGWQVRFGKNSTKKAICRTLYDGATVFLPRKRELAASVTDRESPRSWAHLTADELGLLRAKAGSWGEVADELGIARAHLCAWRRKLGMPRMRHGRNLSDITAESLLYAYADAGTWNGAADSLGVAQGSITNLRRRLGLL